MKIAVLGSGSWGTALAYLLSKNGYEVSLWSRRNELAKQINKNKENLQYLPGIKLSESLISMSSISKSLDGSSVVVFAVPSDALRSVIELSKDHIEKNALIVHAGKGLEAETGMRGSEIIGEILGMDIGSGCVVLSGPNLAVELANNIPTATVVASYDEENAIKAQTIFSTSCFRAYRNTDIIGVELGGSLKNVLGIGAGISDGLGYGDNTKATLATRGLAEITRLGVALGAHSQTFTGLSGIGDIIATCGSKLSRNLRLGMMLGQGKTVNESLEILGQVAEGVHSCEAAYKLSKKLDIYMPITNEIYYVVFENKPPKQAVIDLMTRIHKDELS